MSKARRAGVDLPPPREGETSEETRKSAASAYREGQSHRAHKTSAKRSRAATKKLKEEGHSAASHLALSRQAKSVARRKK